MDRSARLHSLVAPLRGEVLAGASEVAGIACDALVRGAGGIEAGSVAELRAAVAELGTRILDAQPAMAPLVALVTEVLDAVGGAGDVPSARAAARGAALAFREGLRARAPLLAERTAALLPDVAVVLTISSSSSVRDALLHRSRLRPVEVVVLESRPLQEGQRLAAELARAGIPVTVAVDAAAATLARRCSAVLLGADSVGDLGVVNKLGSAAVALAGRRAGIPVMVSTDGTKILPPAFPQDLADDRPAGEVMNAPAGVKVWNRYFEAVPLEDVTRVVTEAGAFSPAELAERRAGMRVPEELWAWAEHRRPDHPGGRHPL
jgi:translation initiation factor 2B subunit (eIF-2B alpha/beta/delta family)